jgi:hypothetical protein
MKASGEQYDERIVECAWDEDLQSWKFMRFRDDKHDGNFIDIVDKIIESIRDGVVQAQVGLAIVTRAWTWADRMASVAGTGTSDSCRPEGEEGKSSTGSWTPARSNSAIKTRCTTINSATWHASTERLSNAYRTRVWRRSSWWWFTTLTT